MAVVDKQPVVVPIHLCGSFDRVCEVADPTPNVVPANYELQAKRAAAEAIDRLDVSG